ncbi:hypothetical protein ABPG72_003282 [Tetrahymena utriculariae]
MKLFFSSSSGKEKIPKNLNITQKNIFGNSENQAVVFQNLRIAVITACISTENTEVIINPSNSSLSRTTGISHAVVNKGGKKLIAECNQIIQNYGQIEPGNAIISSAGDLHCKKVIHAVVPSIFQNSQEAELFLRSVIFNSLKLCDLYYYKSISIPIMSSGNMVGFSKEKSALIIFNAVIEYILNNSTNIKHIRFTNLDKSISEVFTNLLLNFQKRYVEVLASQRMQQQKIIPRYRISLESNSSNSSDRNSYEQ